MASIPIFGKNPIKNLLQNQKAEDLAHTKGQTDREYAGVTRRNSRPRVGNFALNGTQEEVGVSLKKIFFYGDSFSF